MSRARFAWGASAVKPLADRIAVVAGATRGAGRGIARMLGEAGATVYCTGRSTSGSPATLGRPETIEETAELVSAAGGHGIPVRVDHSQSGEVSGLFERVRRETGRLDVLVNDVWGGDTLTEWRPFWTLDPQLGFAMLDRAVRTHILTNRFGAPLMVERKRGLIVEITDGDHQGYRGSLFYDLAKLGAMRLAFAMAEELRSCGVTALSVTPGFLRSEAMLERLGVTEHNWQDAAPRVRGFEESETPCYVGRAVAALAVDPRVHVRSGGAYASWTLAQEYGFSDVDGRRPDWGGYVSRSIGEILDRGGPADDEESAWVDAWHGQLRADPRWRALIARIEALRARTRA